MTLLSGLTIAHSPCVSHWWGQRAQIDLEHCDRLVLWLGHDLDLQTRRDHLGKFEDRWTMNQSSMRQERCPLPLRGWSSCASRLHPTAKLSLNIKVSLGRGLIR